MMNMQANTPEYLNDYQVKLAAIRATAQRKKRFNLIFNTVRIALGVALLIFAAVCALQVYFYLELEGSELVMMNNFEIFSQMFETNSAQVLAVAASFFSGFFILFAVPLFRR